MGLCLKDLGQYREAIAAVHKAEALDRERTDVYNLMGYCYYKLKEHEKAIDCFKRVLELNPASAIDYANIGSNYRDMGDKKKPSATTARPGTGSHDRLCAEKSGKTEK